MWHATRTLLSACIGIQLRELLIAKGQSWTLASDPLRMLMPSESSGTDQHVADASYRPGQTVSAETPVDRWCESQHRILFDALSRSREGSSVAQIICLQFISSLLQASSCRSIPIEGLHASSTLDKVDEPSIRSFIHRMIGGSTYVSA